MKHVVMSKAWDFSSDPFPAYRASLVYGRNKRDREFLPVKDVTPVCEYRVTSGDGRTVLYSGSDEAEAEAAKAKYDDLVDRHNESAGVNEPNPEYPQLRKYHAEMRMVGLPILPEGRFRVIKTRDKGTILVVPGEDTTSRCLLFVGCAGGFRGGESVLEDGTTGTILKKCSAGNACEGSTEVIALLEVGQTVAFHTYGRRTNEVYVYTWDGGKVVQKHFSNEEWDNRNAVAAPPEDIEIL